MDAPKTQRIHEFLKSNAPKTFGVKEIAEALELDPKQVTNGLRQLEIHRRLVGVQHLAYGQWSWEEGHEHAPLPWTIDSAPLPPGAEAEPFLKISWENDTPDAIVALYDSCARQVCRINGSDVFVESVENWSLLCSGWNEAAGEPGGMAFAVRFEDIREIVFY